MQAFDPTTKKWTDAASLHWSTGEHGSGLWALHRAKDGYLRVSGWWRHGGARAVGNGIQSGGQYMDSGGINTRREVGSGGDGCPMPAWGKRHLYL